MPTITEIKKAVAAAVDIAGLNSFHFVPDRPPEPCFYTGQIEIDPNQTFGGSDEMRLTCMLLTSRSDDRVGQERLDAYLSRQGAQSVRARLNAARGAPGESALGGMADDMVVDRITGYRYYLVGETRYYGAQIILRLIGVEEGN